MTPTVLGMSLEAFTLLHVLISLVAIVSGLVVLYGMITGKRLSGWTGFFLLTTVLTSVTGFFFPFTHLLPSHKVGILSLVLLAIALLALYSFHLAGGWRKTYVIAAVMSLYLNVFVLVAQGFLKIPALKAMAPTGTEPPFKVVQGIVLVIFIFLGFKAVKGFRNAT
jgi:hypothetical protein